MMTPPPDFDRVMRATGAHNVAHIVTLQTPMSLILTGPRAGELHMLMPDSPDEPGLIALGRAHVDIQRLVLPSITTRQGQRVNPFADARLKELIGSAPSSGHMLTFRDFTPVAP